MLLNHKSRWKLKHFAVFLNGLIQVKTRYDRLVDTGFNRKSAFLEAVPIPFQMKGSTLSDELKRIELGYVHPPANFTSPTFLKLMFQDDLVYGELTDFDSYLRNTARYIQGDHQDRRVSSYTLT